MQLKTTSSLVLALALICGSGAVFAQDMSKTGKPLTAQQEKMKTCSADAKAKGLKGAEYTAFRNTCLKGGSATETKTATAAAAPVAPAVPAKNAKGHSAGKDEDLQRRCKSQGAKGEGLHGV